MSYLVISQVHPSLRVDTSSLERLLHHVLDAEGRALRSLSVVLTDHATVLALNRSYLAHDYVTDVLSFDLSEGHAEAVEGEIYIDLDTAAERHREFETSFGEEVRRYAVHGLLHLLGYDDTTLDARAHMQALEDRYLATTSGPQPSNT